jgi:plasmid stabilization system protein ParE
MRAKSLTDQPLRFWTVGAYLVIYRAERTPIEIVAVTRGGRDIPRLLRRRRRASEQ